MMEFVDGKDDIPYMTWKIKAMFETTNVYIYILYIYIYICMCLKYVSRQICVVYSFYISIPILDFEMVF